MATKLATTAIPFEQYFSIDDEACDKRIDAAKQKLGDDLVILGHHYQRNEVFKHADFSGDSLKLSRNAAESDAQYILSLIHI